MRSFFIMLKKNTILKISCSVLLFFLCIFLFFHFVDYFKKKNSMVYGVTFNYEYAQFLGLNPREVYTALFEKWNFKYIRISAQWNLIEKKEGKYDFGELDFMMDEAKKHDAKIVLVVGQKTPRWPECHDPEWVQSYDDEKYKEKLQIFIQEIVNRYKNHAALELWQVENEPFLNFGLCRRFDANFLDQEIALVKKFDSNHQVIITDSGELSTWRKTAGRGDYFGSTFYRVVWNKYLGYLTYDWVPSSFYSLRRALNGVEKEKAFIIELQAEPWIPNGIEIKKETIDEQLKSMNIKRLEKNIQTAERTGFSRGYLWGVEWWYWLEKQGRGEISEYIKSLSKK